MGSAIGPQGGDAGASDDRFDADAYLDAADRLERAMDTQVQIIEGIDTKAEHVTRLIALLLGILFSVISLVTQLRETPFASPPPPILAAFGIGVGSLLVSMGTGVITYLSSQYKIGLNDDVGEFLSDASVSTGLNEHLRNVLGTYAFVIRQNRQVIETNVVWFRLSLLFLLVGVLFVSLSGLLFVGGFGDSTARTAVIAASLLSFVVGYYILSASFLPFQDENNANE